MTRPATSVGLRRPDGLGLARAPDGAGTRLREHVFRRVQAPAADIDPAETEDWLESLDQVVEQSGETRAQFLVYKLLKRARQLQIGLPPLTQTRYINTISPGRADVPGRRGMELRIRRIVRWNAVAMVLAPTRSSPASAAISRRTPAPPACTRPASTTSSGARTGERRPDLLPGPRGPGHRPGVPRGRLTEDQLDHFRRESIPGKSGGPHPASAADARLLGVPDGVDGPGPSAHLPGRFNRYLHNRGCSTPTAPGCGHSSATARPTSPSRSARSTSRRARADNLTFVVNCNLQRLGGPVRGNGKIIQELEAVFRGSGWNVIKVVWAREWDELLAHDVDGVLVQQMNDTLDGEFQKFSVAGGAYIREHFFGPDPRLRKLVEHLSDDDLAKLRRGGHDCRKLYAACKAATEFKGA